MTAHSFTTAHDANAQGLAAMRAGDFATASQCYSAAVALDPAAPSLWMNLAHARRELRDDVGERAALAAVLDIDRTNLSAVIRMAQLHERLGEMREAIGRWSGVIQLAAAVQPMPPALQDIVDHARSYCTTHRERLQALVTAQLAPVLPGLDERDARRAQAFLDHTLAGRPVYRNECAGLYYPFLPADEFFDAAHFPWFAELTAASGAIRAELSALLGDAGDAIRPYVQQDKGTPANKWSPLDHSRDWSACFLWEYGVPNQPVLDRCPQTAAVLERLLDARIPGRSPNAFFSILEPHTHIPPHTGVTNTRAIIHLPLIVPDHCGFRVGGETRIWEEGVPFAFDDTIEHEAWNNSDALRAVLIFDVWNPHLSSAEQDVLTRYFASADALD